MRLATLAHVLVATLAIAPAAMAQQVAPEIFTLPNGMKFLLVPRSDQPNTIAAGWLAKVGSVNERPGITGISHFFEHMMFKGTDTIGTRDPKRDADYRARQKDLRDRINAMTWGEQYARFFKGEIDDPWNPKNDTPALAAMRAELKTLMDEQQGKAGDDEIKKLEADIAKADASTEAGKQKKASMEAQAKRLKDQQAALATILKDEFDQVYTKAGGTGMNAFTSYDLTFYFINVPANKFELKTLMDEQQGKAGDDEIKKLEADIAKADASTEAGKQKKASMEAQAKRLKDQQAALATILKDEFDQVYTKAGGTGMNAFTSYDLTFYFINVPANKFELWAWMESDRLNGSVFREFYSERDVVHEERRLRTESTPTGVFQEQFDSMFWMSSPYSWPVIGWTSDLNSYTMEEALKYWNTFYRPNNLVGIVVGDFDPAAAKATITKYFSRLEAGKQAPTPMVTLEMKQGAEQRMYAEAETQPQVEIRYHTVPFQHKDSYPLDVMASILNGRTGRLYKDMVEGSGIASGASAQQESRKYAGLFSFSAETKGESTPQQLEDAWYAELKKLQTEPVDGKELQKVKNQAMADSYRRLQNNFFLLIQLAQAEAMGDWSEINKESAKIQAVTADDIKRVANQYFDRTNRSVAVFTRKATAPVAVDPELAALPAPMQARARQAAAQIAQETNEDQLKQMLQMMEQQAEQVPPQMKPMLEFMVKKIKARIAELDKD